MRKVFLDDLPHRGKYIRWNESIGFDIPFEYEDIKGSMKIVGVNNDKKSVTLEYLGKEYPITTSRLVQNGIAKILGVHYGRRKSHYSIGDVINNKKITNIIFKDGITQYEFECLTCHQVNPQPKYNLENCGCPVCNCSKIIIPEVNGIKGLYPEVYLLIKDKDKDLYGSKSNHKVHWDCPYCKNDNYTAVCKLTEAIDSKNPLPCRYCKKSFSLGESILYGVLLQTTKKFDHHIKFEWSKNKEYDAYSDGVIIEMHGLQHYEKQSFFTYRTLEEEQENDRIKEELAKQNGIREYVIIDCRHSDFEYIKKNIINSKIDKYLNFSFDDVDWEYIASLVKQGLYIKIKELYESNTPIKQIVKELNISKTTLYNHLKFCERTGLIVRIDKRTNNHTKRKTRCKNTSEIFDSCTDAALWCGLKSSTSINSCCNNIPGFKSAGRHPITKEKLEWEYVD